MMQPIECNAENPSIYTLRIEDGEPVFGCRCMVCGRCNNHTGNSHQGHYWKFCVPLGGMAKKFHFCCPDDCELGNVKAVSKV